MDLPVSTRWPISGPKAGLRSFLAIIQMAVSPVAIAMSFCPLPTYTDATGEIVYVDLYIDVVVREDRSVYTKDQEVFDRAAQRYPIVAQSRQKSFEVLDWLEQHAKKWTGPFSTLPRRLPRSDFETMNAEEIKAVLQP